MLTLQNLVKAIFVFGFLFYVPAKAQSTALPASTNSGTSVAVSVESADSKQSEIFSKMLVEALKKKTSLTVIPQPSGSSEFSTASSEQGPVYRVAVSIAAKKKKSILAGRIPLHEAPAPDAPRYSWKLEKAGATEPLYGGQMGEDPKSKDPDGDVALKIADAANIRIQDDLANDRTKRASVVSTGRPRLDIETSHATQVSDFVYSQDGRILATLGIDGVVKIWVNQSKLYHRFNEIRTFAGFRIAGFALSPDGKTLATVDVQRTVRVIDTYQGKIVDTFVPETKAAEPENGMGLFLDFNPIPVAFSQDNHTVVYGGQDGALVIDLQTHQQKATIALGTGQVNVLAISVAGDLVATTNIPAQSQSSHSFLSLRGNSSTEPEITLSRTVDGKAIRTFKAYMSKVSALSFSSDGTMIVAGSQSGLLRIFDTSTGKTDKPLSATIPTCDNPYEWERRLGPVGIVAHGLAGEAAQMCSSFQTVKALAKKDLMSLLSPAAGIRSLAVSGDGKLLAYLQNDNTLRLLALPNSGLTTNIKLADAEQPALPEGGKANGTSTVLFSFIRSSVKFSYDGRYHVNCIRSFKNVSRWDDEGKLESSVAVAKRDLNPFPIPIPVGSVPVFSSDGTRLLTASLTNGVKSWDLRTGTAEQIANIPIYFNFMPISSDGKYTLSSEPDKTDSRKFIVSIHEVGTQVEAYRFPKPFDRFVFPVFSPDPQSRFIALWTGVDGLRIYDSSQKTLVLTIDSVKTFAFSPDASRIAYLSDKGEVNVKTVSTGALSPLKVKLDETSDSLFRPATFVFSQDGSLLAFVNGGKISVFDVVTGAVYREHAIPHATDISNLIFAPGKMRLSFTTDRSLSHWDLGPDQITTSHLATDFWGNLSYSPDGRFLALGGAENRVRLFDVTADEEVGSLISPSEDDWLMINPEGRIDASRLEDIDEVYWVVEEEPITTQPMEMYTRQYFEPRLLTEILGKRPLAPLTQIDYAKVNRALPDTVITNIEPNGSGSVKVTVTVKQSNSDLQHDAAGHLLMSGATKLRLFRDGLMVGYRNLDGAAIPLDSEGKASVDFTVALPHLSTAKAIDFSAYALNSGDIKGLTTHREYKLGASDDPAIKRAYIIAMGVNSSDSNELDPVPFAADDARLMVSTLSAALEKTKNYTEIVPITLVTDKNYRLATRDRFSAVLKILAGQTVPSATLKGVENVARLQKAGPDDLVFVFFSGHGQAANKTFYLIPSDSGKSSGDLNFDPKHSISDDDLAVWFRDIDAGDIVFIADSCFSSALVDPEKTFKAAPMGDPGMGQLAYDKGMRVLAAAESEIRANNAIQRGVLPNALAQDGLLDRQADFHPKDGKIFMGEWLSYSVKRVGGADSKSNPNHQVPVLFNFLWRQADPLIEAVP